jgi:hypothetical protein
MSRQMLLVLVIIILIVATLPTWPYSSGWGVYPGGLLGIVLLIIIILILFGRL